jgi:hypothetical protein
VFNDTIEYSFNVRKDKRGDNDSTNRGECDASENVKHWHIL